MRIAFISFEYPPDTAYGGIATYVQQAARLMVRRGHDVEVFASSPNRSESSDDEGVRVHWIREDDTYQFATTLMPQFRDRHRDRAFDIVEGPEYSADAREVRASFPALPLVVKLHTPRELLADICGQDSSASARLMKAAFNTLRKAAGSVVRGRGFPRHHALRELHMRREVERHERDHARSAVLVLSPSLSLAEFAVRRWKIPRAHVRHVPYPFIPNSRMLEIAPETQSNIVGFLGRLEWRKGFQDLAAAIPIIARAAPSARFRFIGKSTHIPREGIMGDELVLREAGKYADRVEIGGPVPLASIPEELARMDVTVFPSIWENFPNVCLEAMSAARGVIGSRAGGMAEMLADDAGILVNPQRPPEIAAAILRYLRNPEERIQCGCRARQRVLDEYNGNRIGSLMEQVYTEAIHRRSSRPC